MTKYIDEKVKGAEQIKNMNVTIESLNKIYVVANEASERQSVQFEDLRDKIHKFVDCFREK